MGEVSGGMRFQQVGSIGIFRALPLGEMLSIVPALRAVRRAYPEAHITLIGLPPQREFVRRFNYYLNDFIEFPGWPGMPEPQEPESRTILTFLQEVREHRFDLLLQMHGDGIVANSMCLLWGAKHVCGLRAEGRYCPDNELFPLTNEEQPDVLRFLKLVDALKIPRQGEALEFPLMSEEIDNFIDLKARLHLSSGRYICIHPGARDPRKRWPVENFAFVARHLGRNGFQLVLTGSMSEKSTLKELEDQLDFPVLNITTAAGQIGIGELAMVFKTGLALISNDNGVSQIASALRIPATIIFSKYSDIRRWGPIDRTIHQAIPSEKADDPEYVLYRILDQLEKQPRKQTPVLLH